MAEMELWAGLLVSELWTREASLRRCSYDGQVEVADERAEVSLTEAIVGKD